MHFVTLLNIYEYSPNSEPNTFSPLPLYYLRLLLENFERTVQIGLGTEFRSEKIPRNRLGTVSVIPRKKVLIPRHSVFRGRANSEAPNETIQGKNEFLRNSQNNFNEMIYPYLKSCLFLHVYFPIQLYNRQLFKTATCKTYVDNKPFSDSAKR